MKPLAAPRHRLLLVKVDKSLAAGINLYDAARAAWRVDIRRARQAQVVLAVASNQVLGAFVPLRWKPATPEDFPLAVSKPDGRWGFEGEPAPPAVAALYVGRRLPEGIAWRRGSGNPVRYLAPDPAEPALEAAAPEAVPAAAVAHPAPMPAPRSAGPRPKQVICINWGSKYGAPYVNRLYAMVARNLTPPFSFTCFTDSAEGFRPEVRAEPLPPLEVRMPVGTKGIWPKARLWSAALADLSGPVLFMDLDLVVVGSLDDFFSFGGPEAVVLARNPNTPLERLGQTSIFRFPVGKLLPLQRRFLADPQGVADTYQFEQRYVTREAPGGVAFWPAPWVRHFRYHCARPFPLNFFLPPKLQKDARVVIFPGGLLPPHAIEGHWGRAYKPVGAAAHLKGLFAADRPDPPLRYLRHFLRPAPWVAEAWRE